MKKTISLALVSLILFPAFTQAEVRIYSSGTSDFAISTPDKNSAEQFAGLVFFYGGSSDGGEASSADCLIKAVVKRAGKNYFSGHVVPISTEITSYDQKDILGGEFKINFSSHIAEVSNLITLDICADGVDFTGKYMQIKDKSEKYINRLSEIISMVYEDAKIKYKLGDVSGAAKGMDEIIKNGSNGISLHDFNENKVMSQIFNDTGFYLQRSGRHHQAIKYFLDVVKYSPERVVAKLNLADSYWAMGEYDLAKAEYKNFISASKEKGGVKKLPERVGSRIK